MKVAHVSCVVPPAGGIGTVAMREVSGLRSRGVEASLFAPESRNAERGTSERPFVQLVPAAWHIGNASWLIGIRKRLAAFDLVHIHWPFFGTADRLMFRPSGLPPVVITFHMDAEPKGIEAWPIAAERLLLQRRLLSNADRIIVSSFDYAASSSIRKLFRDQASKFVELPFGVDLDRYAPGPSVRDRFAVPAGAPTVLFVGGLDKAHAFKGVDVLLQAVAGLDPATHLLIVGDGDLRPEYEERARQLGIAARTHFLGRVDDATVVDAYRSADVFAFPSTNRAEAFGLVALESQACGLPVVASDLPGLRQVVRANETGMLVKPGSVQELANALGSVLADEALRHRLSRAAPGHARKFSWDSHLDGLIAVYKQVCASPSS